MDRAGNRWVTYFIRISWICVCNSGWKFRITWFKGCSRDLSYDQYHIGICIPLRVFIAVFSSLLIDTNELETILRELKYRIGIQSAKLLRQLKQKDRLVHKVQRNCDIVTACLQAVSQKRSKCAVGLALLPCGTGVLVKLHQ